MGRKAKAWWWEERKGYYAFVGGTRHRLADTKKAADRVLDALRKSKSEHVPSTAVSALLDAFLTWTNENRSPKTYRGYKDFCQSFKDKCPRLSTSEFTAQHVTDWLDTKKTWNSTTKRGAITCLQRAMNWATKNWGLKDNPLRGMEKPQAKRRETIISPEEFKNLLAAVTDAAFKELLIVSNEVGCRPQEVKQLEACHVDMKNNCWLIPTELAKGKRQPRVVYMTDKAERIVKRLLKERPKGKLFLNARGRPWTASAVKCRFANLEKKLGVRYCQTLFRHAWITRKILAGVDSHVLAALAGHRDSSMIDRVYSKVAANHKFMLAEARR